MKTRFLFPFLVFLAVGFPPSVSGQRAAVDPLTLFAKLMPVLSHDRCVNCHGATDPYTGDYHPGAIKQTTPCFNCHTATQSWRLAPPPAAFFKKTTRQLCSLFEQNIGANEGTALHLQADELIGLAFVGRRGNAVDRSFAKPPPMSRPEFVRAFRTWIKDGGGTCSAWEGTITRTETIATDTMPGSGPNARNVHHAGKMDIYSWQNGTHSYTINIKNGVATVSTTHTGEKYLKGVGRDDACEPTTLVRTAYGLVSVSPPTDQAGAGPLVATGDGSVRVGLSTDGSYRIHVVPPRETTQQTTTTIITNKCGPAPKVPASTETSDWSEWVFEIVGKLANPKDRWHIKGQSTIDVDSSYDPSFGLAYQADVARQDGTPLKFRITTTWDLSRVP